MTVGYPINKAVIDSRAGYLVKTLHDVLTGANVLKARLDALTNADLVGMGYTDAEATLLKAAFTDLYNLNRVATGQATQSPANNFFFSADKLTGVE